MDPNLTNSPSESPIPNEPPSSTTPPTDVSNQTYTPATSPMDLNPSTQTDQNPSTLVPDGYDSEMKRRSGRFKVLGLLLLFLFLFVVLGGSGLAYAVAYEKVKFDKYPDLQKRVSYFVISLPFMPKTPKFLLARTGLAHQDITKQSFDMSFALNSADFTQTLGVGALDFAAKGALDYSDPKNIIFTVNAQITKDVDLDLMKMDKILYFKINKFNTAVLSALLGLEPGMFEEVLGKWVSYDTTPLDTEARRNLEDQEVDPLSEQYIDDNLEKFVDEKVLQKMKLESVVEGGYPVYKITLDADTEIIDHLGKQLYEDSPSAYTTTDNSKLSDLVKKLKWEIFIDRGNYFTRKFNVTAELESDTYGGPYNSLFLGTTTSPTTASKMQFSFVGKFDDFGKDVIINTPTDSLTFEEFTQILSAIFRSPYTSQDATDDYSNELPVPLPLEQ